MKGWCELRTPADLGRKLQRDHKRLETDPINTDAAFDFFMTAHAIIDWVHPDSQPDYRRLRQVLLSQDPLLPIAGHLCNGAKHFEAIAWNQVEALQRQGGWWARGYWAPGFWNPNFWRRPRLLVRLSPAEAARFSVPELDVLDVAKGVREFWEKYLGI